MGLALSLLLGVAGAARAAIFMTPFTETLAITTSLVAIVFISVLFGAILPIMMKFCKIDPGTSHTIFLIPRIERGLAHRKSFPKSTISA